MRTSIHATQRDILLGVQDDSSLCPLARAVKRVVRPIYSVRVEKDGITVAGHHVLSNNARLRRFVTRFDKRRSSVQPLSLLLDIPYNYLRPSVFKQVKQ